MYHKPVIFVIVLFVIAATIGALFFIFPEKSSRPPKILSEEIVPTPTRAASEYPVVTVGGRKYSYGLIRAAGAQVRLIPNFQNRKASFELARQYGCTRYVNGSYYDKSYRPLGLFFSEGSTLGNDSRSPLLNGYLWQDDMETNITMMPPRKADWILQTGPMLIDAGTALSLTLRDDEPARRTAAMTGTDGDLFFLSVFHGESVLTGPYLSELPEVLYAIARKTGIDPGTAVNLDGGSASAFHDGEHTLSEFTSVGSILCLSE